MQEIQDQHSVSEETRTAAANALAKGNEVRAFCWELAFPELFFEPEPEGQGVRRRERHGFDAMVGNPPWDRIEPKRKEFFSRYDPAIRVEGATGLRRMLFSQARVEAIYSFENWGKRFFQIHASFKFLTLTFENQQTAAQSFPGAFMLRNEGFLALPEKESFSIRA